jgi:hypothetical protein
LYEFKGKTCNTALVRFNKALQEAKRPEPSSPTITATSNADEGKGRILLAYTLFSYFHSHFSIYLIQLFQIIAFEDWVLRYIHIPSLDPQPQIFRS